VVPLESFYHINGSYGFELYLKNRRKCNNKKMFSHDKFRILLQQNTNGYLIQIKYCKMILRHTNSALSIKNNKTLSCSNKVLVFKKNVKMLRVTIFVGVIWILIRIITIVLLLDGKSGNWSPIHGAGHIMALIQVNLFL
jgi:hypothetical protein